MQSQSEVQLTRMVCLHDAPRQANSANRLLETGDLSDFSVVCGDRTWKVHKFILCSIEYFNKLIASGFRVFTPRSV